MTKRLTEKDVEFRLECESEHIPLRGNCMASGDKDIDEQCARDIEEQLDAGNEWAWCSVCVRGTFKGLEARDYLGGCSYASEEDFKAPGGYWDDMKGSVLADLQAQLDEICGECC